jgi:hypothetical protein
VVEFPELLDDMPPPVAWSVRDTTSQATKMYVYANGGRREYWVPRYTTLIERICQLQFASPNDGTRVEFGMELSVHLAKSKVDASGIKSRTDGNAH